MSLRHLYKTLTKTVYVSLFHFLSHTTQCKIRLSLGSGKTQNQSIFYWPYNVFILFHMFQGYIPEKMNAKSHPARHLAPFTFLSQKTGNASLTRQLCVFWRHFGMSVSFIM